MTLPVHPSPGARRPATGRLAIRLAMGLGLGAAVVLLAAGWWGLTVQRRQMTALVQLGAEHGALIVRSATRDAMSRNDPDAVQRILESVGAQRGIERIRILDKQGRIVRSTDPSEMGRTVDRRAEQCTVCHAADQPLENPGRADRMRVFEKASGERVLAVVEPIPNEPD
ncbi:MAG TPA: hypothetical protein VND21_06735, partial [Planctomycetota bacterium]|nr:hypothetical protein [Planctomycetota bacterium]